MMHRPTIRGGFSLVEMLVVMAVLSVVTTIGVTMFATITGSYRETERRMDLGNVAQNAFDSIRKDCSQVTTSSLAGVPLRGVREMEEQVRYGRVPLEDDRLILPVSYFNPLQDRMEHVTVMYHIDRSEGQPKLVRTMQGGYGAEDPAGAQEVIIPGALSMRFEFFDGTAWQPGWSAATHPEAVRCSITVSDLDRPYEQVSRSAAFPIRVR